MNLDKLTELEWIINRDSPLRKHTDFERSCYSSKTRSRILRSEGEVLNNTLTFGTSFVSFAFRLHDALILLRCHFLKVFCLLLRWNNLDGNSSFLGALKSTSLSRHTCHRTSSTARILTAHSCTRVLHH